VLQRAEGGHSTEPDVYDGDLAIGRPIRRYVDVDASRAGPELMRDVPELLPVVSPANNLRTGIRRRFGVHSSKFFETHRGCLAPAD